MRNSRLIGGKPKIGIRPIIDGRRGGIRESLEDMTMAMTHKVAELYSSVLRHSDGTSVECVIADTTIGGKKVPFVMQTLTDMPIRVVCSEQACALGAAMFAAVAAGVYKDINEATRQMGSDIEAEYRPDEKRALIYETLYKKYLELAKLAETIN